MYFEAHSKYYLISGRTKVVETRLVGLKEQAIFLCPMTGSSPNWTIRLGSISLSAREKRVSLLILYQDLNLNENGVFFSLYPTSQQRECPNRYHYLHYRKRREKKLDTWHPELSSWMLASSSCQIPTAKACGLARLVSLSHFWPPDYACRQSSTARLWAAWTESGGICCWCWWMRSSLSPCDSSQGWSRLVSSHFPYERDFSICVTVQVSWNPNCTFYSQLSCPERLLM